MSLKGNTVLVTGAGNGIGAAIAHAMAQAGANIIAADIDEASAGSSAEQAASHGVKTLAVQADCGNVAGIDAMVDSAVAEFGKLGIGHDGHNGK